MTSSRKFIALIAGLALVGGGMTAHAATVCGAKNPTAQEGWSSFVPADPDLGYEGVSSQLTIRWSHVCDPGDPTGANRSLAWVMAFSTLVSNPSKQGWMQAGHMRWYNSNIIHFVQWTRDGTDVANPPAGYTYFGSQISPGSLVTYKVQWTPISGCSGGHGCEKSFVGATSPTSTWWDPFNNGTYTWKAPLKLQWHGETDYAASDIPGSSPTSDQEGFGSIQAQKFVNDLWTTTVNMQASADDDHERASVSAISNNAFTIWCDATCGGSH